MTTIIGIDGALAATGIAVWRNGQFNVLTVHTAAGGPPEPRWAHIGEQIYPMATSDPDTLVVLEGVFVGAQVAGTALSLAMLHGTLRLGMHYRKVPCAVVDVIGVKQYAVGAGRATKAEMIAAAVDRLRLRFRPDEHQADALWLASMALDHYGAPLCDTSAAGRKALARTKWPLKFALIEKPVTAWR